MLLAQPQCKCSIASPAQPESRTRAEPSGTELGPSLEPSQDEPSRTPHKAMPSVRSAVPPACHTSGLVQGCILVQMTGPPQSTAGPPPATVTPVMPPLAPTRHRPEPGLAVPRGYADEHQRAAGVAHRARRRTVSQITNAMDITPSIAEPNIRTDDSSFGTLIYPARS